MSKGNPFEPKEKHCGCRGQYCQNCQAKRPVAAETIPIKPVAAICQSCTTLQGEIERLKHKNQQLENNLQKQALEINDLKNENQQLRANLQKAEENAKKWELAQWKIKQQAFQEKFKQEGWNVSQAEDEDIEFLFEEFGIIQHLAKLKNEQGYSTFDDFTVLDAQTATEMLGIDLIEASKLVFNIELMENGILSKEDKEKHLRNCAICRMGVKKGLEEYGVAGKASRVIAEKLGGMELGEVMQFTQSQFMKLGIDKSMTVGLVKAAKQMKANHSFAGAD